jgi:hypothetical protein
MAASRQGLNRQGGKQMSNHGSTIQKLICGAGLAATLAAGLSACASEESTIDTTDEEIIGGVSANSAKLNAVGTLGVQIAPGFFVPYCTATLVSPTVVLTAEHCIELLADPSQGAFLIGPNANAPIRTVPIRGSVAEISVEGGMLNYGSDTAVVHLAEAVTDVAPMRFAALSDSQIGRRFTGIGFGQQDSLGTSGTRRAGSMTLTATGGRVFDAAFGSFDGFLADGAPLLFPGYDPSNPFDLAYLEEQYEATRLIDGIEAWFGARAGDAQSCSGDSGGPITARDGNQTVLYGVASWVYRDPIICALIGGAYSSINHVTLDFLDYELNCPLIPKEGACDGETVVRCAQPEEGGRRELRTDCSELGLYCGFDEIGELGCIDDPCEGIPAEGVCNGDVATRCSGPDEGPRRVIETNCAITGDSCGIENGSVTCIDNTDPVCPHDVCTTGSPLDESCGSCAAQICAVDSYCCNTAWDSICVGEVATVCGQTCPGATAIDPADLARRAE